MDRMWWVRVSFLLSILIGSDIISKVDSEVCLEAGCPFVAKDNERRGDTIILKGTCIRALVTRREKNKVCISNVDMKVDKKRK